MLDNASKPVVELTTGFPLSGKTNHRLSQKPAYYS
jgi:hypothetical protein